jgi:hypothetical protein
MCSIDIKVTVWERIEFHSEEEMNDVLAKLRSGELESGCDIADYLDRSSSYIDNTSEEVRIHENNGMATMEVLNEDGNTIWNNADGDIMLTDEEPSKFICGVCGDHVDNYTYNEEKDIDECDNCKE